MLLFFFLFFFFFFFFFFLAGVELIIAFMFCFYHFFFLGIVFIFFFLNKRFFNLSIVHSLNQTHGKKKIKYFLSTHFSTPSPFSTLSLLLFSFSSIAVHSSLRQRCIIWFKAFVNGVLFGLKLCISHKINDVFNTSVNVQGTHMKE